MPEHDFNRIFIRPLETLRIEYAVTGSVAALMYGQLRLTHDIDLDINLHTKDIQPSCKSFPEQGVLLSPS